MYQVLTSVSLWKPARSTTRQQLSAGGSTKDEKAGDGSGGSQAASALLEALSLEPEGLELHRNPRSRAGSVLPLERRSSMFCWDTEMQSRPAPSSGSAPQKLDSLHPFCSCCCCISTSGRRKRLIQTPLGVSSTQSFYKWNISACGWTACGEADREGKEEEEKDKLMREGDVALNSQ